MFLFCEQTAFKCGRFKHTKRYRDRESDIVLYYVVKHPHKTFYIFVYLLQNFSGHCFKMNVVREARFVENDGIELKKLIPTIATFIVLDYIIERLLLGMNLNYFLIRYYTRPLINAIKEQWKRFKEYIMQIEVGIILLFYLI